VDRISPEAPVPVVRVARREDRLGGAANVARNIAALGAQATLVGVVGDDEAGRSIAALSRQEGIDARLVVDPQLPTTLKMRVMGRQQQLLRVDFEENPEGGCLDTLQDEVEALIGRYDMIVLSDYAKGALARVEGLIQAAHAAGIPVLVDPKGHAYRRYAGAPIITPNRAEMMDAVGRGRTEAELEAR